MANRPFAFLFFAFGAAVGWLNRLAIRKHGSKCLTSILLGQPRTINFAELASWDAPIFHRPPFPYGSYRGTGKTISHAVQEAAWLAHHEKPR